MLKTIRIECLSSFLLETSHAFKKIVVNQKNLKKFNYLLYLLVVSALITNCASIDMYNAGVTGDVETLNRLIKDGVDVNEPPMHDNKTSLFAAACNGHKKAVKLLLENGADPNIISMEYEYLTPIMAASRNGYTDIVHLLEEYDANVNVKYKKDSSPLYLASQNGNVTEVKKLLDIGVNVNVLTEDNVSPLYIASQNGHFDIVNLLIKNGADVNIEAKNKATPLYVASQNGNSDTVKLLLNSNSNVDYTFRGYTPLGIAVKKGNIEVAKILLLSGANIELKHPCTFEEYTFAFANELAGQEEINREKRLNYYKTAKENYWEALTSRYPKKRRKATNNSGADGRFMRGLATALLGAAQNYQSQMQAKQMAQLGALHQASTAGTGIQGYYKALDATKQSQPAIQANNFSTDVFPMNSNKARYNIPSSYRTNGSDSEMREVCRKRYQICKKTLKCYMKNLDGDDLSSCLEGANKN